MKNNTKAQRQAAWLIEFTDHVVSRAPVHAGRIEWPSALHFYFTGLAPATSGARINPGDTIIYDTATRRARLQPDSDTITFYGESGPSTFYRNRAGRCEDAPCCGCCTI